MKTLVHEFLNGKRELAETGELAQRSHEVYQETGQLLAKKLGRERFVADPTAEDLRKLRASLAKGHGPVWLASTLQLPARRRKKGCRGGVPVGANA